MPDVVVTVPKTFRYAEAPGQVGLRAWLAEGDPPGSPWSGQLYEFSCGNVKPDIAPGERVYVVCEGRLVGYAPLVRLSLQGRAWKLIRGGGAVACTIPDPIIGFMGFRYRWWDRAVEQLLPELP